MSTFSLLRSCTSTLLTCLALAACGGGGSEPPPANGAPTIEQYSAERASYNVGERAKLTVRYSGGAGRIEPGIGAIASGATIETPALDATTRYTLVVESGAGVARRELTVGVSYRNAYRTVAQDFRAAHHRAVLAGDGSVVIIGGSRGLSAISADIDRFDPRTERFTRIGSLVGGPFMGETATRLSDGRILVFGARLQSDGLYAEVIDERTGVATATGDMLVPRLDHAAVALPDDRVLITGGRTPEGYPGAISPTAELWDPKTGEFRRLAESMHLPRANHTATLLADGRVLIVGGFTATAPYLLAEIFDPKTEQFTLVPSNDQTVRALHESIRLENGDVLVVAGEENLAQPHKSVLLWNRGAGVFQPLPDLLVPRSIVRAATTRLGRVLLYGGATQHHPVASSSAETYTLDEGGAGIAPMPKARAWHTVTRLNDGRVLILGGEDANGALIAEALIYE